MRWLRQGINDFGQLGIGRSKIVLAVVETQVALAEQFGMQAAQPLANPDALGKMGVFGGKEGNQVSSARADIVHRKGFRTGRTTDIDDLSQPLLKVDKGTLSVADKRADDQKAFTGFTFQLQGESRVPLEEGSICQN